ncbi:MAG TPA: hypothetical protein PKE39_16685 [Ignavibacteria bacterium]|nr:hypothetical protein [Ignavibacteria bacterium]
MGGLSDISSPSGEYGVYFYCNDRLIARALTTSVVGFETGTLGVPHPSMSLAKVFVFLKGPADLMPWNSSKSNINANHEVFIGIKPYIIQTLKQFTSLSKRKSWKSDVFPFKEGEIKSREIKNIKELKRIKFPDLPDGRMSQDKVLAQINENIVDSKPWTKAIYENFQFTKVVEKQKLSDKNLLNLIYIDTIFEMSLKQYLIYESNLAISDSEFISLMKDRDKLIIEIKKLSGLNNSKWNKIWEKIQYYHNLKDRSQYSRNNVNIDDSDITIFRDNLKVLFIELFGINLL